MPDPRHPLLRDLVLDYNVLGPAAAYARTAPGQSIINCVLGRDPFCAIIAVLDTCPTKAAVRAVERYLVGAVGRAEASTRQGKQLAGRVIKIAVQHVGGRHVRVGAEVGRGSIYSVGSTYELNSLSWPQ
jgi:hypothetical protein